MSENTELKAKRVRCNPTKRWSLSEEKALVCFLLENKNFEKPSAQTYYKRFGSEASVDVDWKVARSKVRNMRTAYNKAKSWEGSTGAGSMEGETIKNTLLKMFTFFYEFEDIFGSRLVENAVIEESLESMCSSENCNAEESFNEEETIVTTIETETSPPNRRKGIYSRTAVSDIMKMQTEMLTLKREKIDKDVDLKEKELQIKERELVLKEKEIELKAKEIESREKVKIRELEMKERLEMEELRLKYSK